MGVIMLMPKRTKHRKQFRGRMRGLSKGGNSVEHGEWGIQALEPAWINGRHIEAMRVAIVRTMRRRGKYWIRIFPDKPVTKRGAETRMGSGKGAVDSWVAVVKPGRIMFEIGDVPNELAMEALGKALYKLPIRARVVKREETF